MKLINTDDLIINYAEIIASIAFAIIAIIIIIIMLIKSKKRGEKVGIESVSLGPLTAKRSKILVERMELLSVPLGGCAGEKLSPPLQLLLRDGKGNTVQSKSVRIELYDENGLVSSKNYKGETVEKSNEEGIVTFSKFIINKTGRFTIHIIVDDILEVTDTIDVFPPGLNIDFWNEPVGSIKYEEKLERALRYANSDTI